MMLHQLGWWGLCAMRPVAWPVGAVPRPLSRPRITPKIRWRWGLALSKGSRPTVSRGPTSRATSCWSSDYTLTAVTDYSCGHIAPLTLGLNMHNFPIVKIVPFTIRKKEVLCSSSCRHDGSTTSWPTLLSSVVLCLFAGKLSSPPKFNVDVVQAQDFH